MRFLYHLCLTSRTINAAMTPILYSHVCIRGEVKRRLANLLSNPHLRYIRSFSILSSAKSVV